MRHSVAGLPYRPTGLGCACIATWSTTCYVTRASRQSSESQILSAMLKSLYLGNQRVPPHDPGPPPRLFDAKIVKALRFRARVSAIDQRYTASPARPAPWRRAEMAMIDLV